MKALLSSLLLIACFQAARAQTPPEHAATVRKGYSASFSKGSKIISFGMGFPNLYRISYKEPEGYTHIKTTGFGPLYAKFEIAIADNIGLNPSFGYGTFHYSYFGLAYHPGYTEQVIYYDDVNTLSLALTANFHLKSLITNPKLDVYFGGGFAMNYLKYRYGNIPPYKEPETKTKFVPAARVGVRYYFDPILGAFAEAGYDGLSVLQLGLSVRF